MKLLLRISLIIILALAVLYVVFKSQVDDRIEQYGIKDYVKHRVKTTFKGAKLDSSPSLGAVTQDKAVVMAKVKKEKTDWVLNDLPDWQSAVYTVDPSEDDTNVLQTPENKGREAMAYLTYIIDNYAVLPSVIAFIHPHRDGLFSGWHTDTPLHSNVDAMRSLNLTYVMQKGYTNLRCKHSPGCLEAHLDNAHVTPDIYQEVFQGTTTEVKNRESIPKKVGAACCAQFAVSKDAVRKRPVEDYETMRNWLLKTKLDDAKSGRVFEFLWHIIFGMNAVHCPPEKECYCNVFNRCEDKS